MIGGMPPAMTAPPPNADRLQDFADLKPHHPIGVLDVLDCRLLREWPHRLKRFARVGPILNFRQPSRDQVFTVAYTDREASYLKRFTFGGAILGKEYFCIHEKSRILFIEEGTPEKLYIKYKTVPHQKVSQQVCKPDDVAVRSPKTRGNQISIKDVATISSKPLRNWDADAAT